MQQRILSVQDVSCFGKCSNTVALPVLSACGHECVILPTALLSTHTGDFQGYTFLDLTEEMKKILAHWERLGLRFDAVMTGYFGSVRQLALVRDFVLPRELPRFVDPVMGDRGRLYSIFDGEFVRGMREFCRGADLITPNVTEAALLADVEYRGDGYDEGEMERLLRPLFALGVRQVVLTGVRFGESEIGLLAAAPGVREVLKTPYADTYLHGTGDTFASALCGKLVAGVPFLQAAETALQFTYRCIRRTIETTDARYGLGFEPELSLLSR
ncbi:MAG: pyridoxamine kinase [Oscillospiraceae bacterium]|nr:pyridoxamine kinase [Oscillospiraceae bacterium]